MNEDHKKMLRYYHGEAENPFGVDKQDAAMFWMYEEHFYLEYIENGAKEPFERALNNYLDFLFADYLPGKWYGNAEIYRDDYIKHSQH